MGVGDRTPGASLFCSHRSTLQGYTPDRLPVSSCVTVPDLIPLNPARILFVKVTKSLFGRKKNKSESGIPGFEGIERQGDLLHILKERECECL